MRFKKFDEWLSPDVGGELGAGILIECSAFILRAMTSLARVLREEGK